MQEAFEIYQPFYGSYLRAGTDSQIGSGIAFNGMNLYLIGWSSDIVGEELSSFEIRECVEPRYELRPGDNWVAPFLCNEMLVVDPVSE